MKDEVKTFLIDASGDTITIKYGAKVVKVLSRGGTFGTTVFGTPCLDRAVNWIESDLHRVVFSHDQLRNSMGSQWTVMTRPAPNVLTLGGD